MIVGLLAMLFVLVSAYIVLARYERQSVRLTGKGEEIEAIVESLEKQILSALRPPGVKGESLTGAAYADTFAYYTGTLGNPSAAISVWGATWLSALEPVRDPKSATYTPQDYVYPALSAFNETVLGPRRLNSLLVDAGVANDGIVGVVRVNPVSSPYAGQLELNPDTAATGLYPFGDADGDGLPDSAFSGTAMQTELVNALAGVAVNTQYEWDDVSGFRVTRTIDPSRVTDRRYQEDSELNYQLWSAFNTTARYVVTDRVIPHGGMVQVSAPDDRVQWNSQFTGYMFNWMRFPGDNALDPRTNLQHRQWLAAMAAQRGSVEPFLRRRGGLLPALREEQGDPLPSALATFQSRFYRTFVPWYTGQSGRVNAWQRFNLADDQDWWYWRSATSVDVATFNRYWDRGTPSGQNPRQWDVPRRLLTTVNNSDELARLRSAPYDNDTTGLGLLDAGRLLKFPLTQIAQAFDVNGKFLDYGSDPAGLKIVRELADYYYEMFGDSIRNDGAAEGTWVDDDQAVTPLEQAYMLAVNTVAFAAPRDFSTGKIDVVHYTTAGMKAFYGYGPQPFITQVIAYSDYDEDQQTSDIALAIELFLPQDPGPGGWSGDDLYDPNDDYAVNLGQFALGLNGRAFTETRLLTLVGSERMSGRRFVTISINDEGSNTEFDPHVDGVIGDMSVSTLPPLPPKPERIDVELWRIDPEGLHPHIVDRLTVELDPAPSNLGDWLVDAYRDTNPVLYYGVGPAATPRPARWRMVTELVNATGPIENEQQISDEMPFRMDSLGDERVLIGGQNQVPGAFGPTTPMYTMNAGGGLWQQPLHGVMRPASFPTVGFLLFVPRFSHLYDENVTAYTPMSVTLREHWDEAFGGSGYSLQSVPADFGHMPVFDARQQVSAGSDFKDTGTIPWGLFAFDYFTTHDYLGLDNEPYTGDETLRDPYRVEGRINVNTAPWYVLAGLPVLGPNATSDLPIDPNAAPAFWSSDSGVITGADSYLTPRFPSLSLLFPDLQAQTWRLGPYLAQAITAYRDRIQYMPCNLADPNTFIHFPFPGAHERNGRNPNSVAPTEYRLPLYADLGSNPRGQYDTVLMRDEKWRRGFLGLGELANVMGLDGTVPAQNPTVDDYVLSTGDFMKSIALLAMLDTHFLTTRSNTFTIYTTLQDRQDPSGSVRSQMTVDRTNLLPRLVWNDLNGNKVRDRTPYDSYTLIQNDGQPEIIGRREVSYFNARYDD